MVAAVAFLPLFPFLINLPSLPLLLLVFPAFPVAHPSPLPVVIMHVGKRERRTAVYLDLHASLRNPCKQPRILNGGYIPNQNITHTLPLIHLHSSNLLQHRQTYILNSIPIHWHSWIFPQHTPTYIPNSISYNPHSQRQLLSESLTLHKADIKIKLRRSYASHTRPQVGNVKRPLNLMFISIVVGFHEELGQHGRLMAAAIPLLWIRVIYNSF